MKVKCPKCRKETNWEENEFRPFCSKQCSLIDLGRWIDGDYVISGETPDGEESDDLESGS